MTPYSRDGKVLVMGKDKAGRPKAVKGKNPQAANGPYATGGFVGKGSKHKGQHKSPGLIARLLGRKS